MVLLRFSSFRANVLASIASGLSFTTSCNLLVDTGGPNQCETDSDCARRGSAFAGTLCAKDTKICVDATSCSSHEDCSDRIGEDSYCRPTDAVCSRLLTEDCTEIWPANWQDQDDLVLVGFMAPLTGEQQGYGEPLKEGAALALEEIERFSGGFPGASGQGQRHLAMLVCDHGEDPLAVARHLIDEVKVPAIVGPGFSGVTLKVFNSEAKPKGVLLLSPAATSPAISDLVTGVDNDLLWRTVPSDVLQAEVLKQLLARVEAALGLEHTEAKITVPVKGDAAGQGLANAYQTKAAVENPAQPVGGDNLQRLDYGDPSEEQIDWQTYVENILRFLPDVVLAAGTDEFVANLLPQIEAGWPEKMDRPWYLLPEGNRTSPLITYANAHPEIASRIVGTAPGARSSPGYGSFVARFSGLFRKQPGNLAEFAYDAVYLLSYAMAITGQQFPSGPDLGQALKNVTCKDEPRTIIKAEPNNFTRDFKSAAESGACLDFDGVSGSLDFDSNVGEALSDIGIWCLRPKSGGLTFDPPLKSFYSITTNQLIEATGELQFTRSDWCR